MKKYRVVGFPKKYFNSYGLGGKRSEEYVTLIELIER